MEPWNDNLLICTTLEGKRERSHHNPQHRMNLAIVELKAHE
jgi:hypothetical protein